MKTSKLPIDPGPAGWNRILPPRDPQPPLDKDRRADWLVIGAGFAGVSAARRLSQLRPRDDIVVLEAREIAQGPSGRNSGFMIDLPHDLASDDYGGALDADIAQTQANRIGIDFANSMAQDFDLPTEAFALSGKINAAASDKGHAHNTDYARHLAKMGEDYRFLNANEMHQKTGTSCYKSGLFTPGSAIIQPALYMRSVAKSVVSNRVTLYENSPVVALENTGDWRATTPNGSVTAPKVILAVNGHINSFGHFKNQMMHVFTYASMTRALTAQDIAALGGDAVWNVTPADPMGTTVRRISGKGGDRIVVRNRFTFDPSMQVSNARLKSTAKTHRRSFDARFPMLAHVDMDYTWGGRLCLSRNSVPAFGELETGLFAACCQNGLGSAKGTLAGLAIADLATGTKSEAARYMSAQDAPKTLPPMVLSWLGANAVMRYGEWTAGKEL